MMTSPTRSVEIVREREVSFKEAVNSVIRAGLAADKAVSRP